MALVWRQVNTHEQQPWHEAEGYRGNVFTVMPSATPGMYRLGTDGSLIEEKFASLDDAKAKAQSIDDDRVRRNP